MRTLRLLLIVLRVQAAQLNQQKSLYEAVFDQRLSATGEHIRQFLYYLEQVIARLARRYVPPARRLRWIYICPQMDPQSAQLWWPGLGTTRLRSASQQLMVVPRHHRLSTVGRRAFAVHCPMVWNYLPDDLRAQQDYESFRQGLKTWLFSRY